MTSIDSSTSSNPKDNSYSSVSNDVGMRRSMKTDRKKSKSNNRGNIANIQATKIEDHRKVEQRRRKYEKKYLDELSSLIKEWTQSKVSKFSQLSLLKLTADMMNKIDMHYASDPLLPSYLTKDQMNYLNLEASNSFLFVTTIDSASFRIIHVTQSIHRTLDLMPAQWLDQNLFSFIHPDDLFQVQVQLIALKEQINQQISTECRLKQGDGSYISVIIDGQIKKLDQLLKPVSPHEWGYYCLIGICHLPLTSDYNKKNMSVYKNTQSSIFSCRCTPHDWKIILVDYSISTWPSTSFDSFRNKSILDFIPINEQFCVNQTLHNSTLTAQDEMITCQLAFSSTEVLTMILDVKPILNQIKNKTEFLELTFKNITDLVRNSEPCENN